MPNINIDFTDADVKKVVDFAVHGVIVTVGGLGIKYSYKGIRYLWRLYKEKKDVEVTIHVTIGKMIWGIILGTIFCFIPCVLAATLLLHSLL